VDPRAVAKRDETVKSINSAVGKIKRAQDALYRTRGLGTERCAAALGDLIRHYEKVRADLMRLR